MLLKPTTTYIYDDMGTPVRVTKDGANYYFIYNAQGDTVALTDDSGAVVATYKYDPWGNILEKTGSVDTPFTYRAKYGYIYDKETNLYFLKSRYYDPETGRFTTKDRFEGFEDAPASQHPYLYCEGDPVNKVDPEGESYVGLNVAWGIGPGVTLGVMVDHNYKVYAYGGGGLVIAPFGSAALTWSPNNPSKRWNKSIQAAGFAAMEVGYARKVTKDSFIELGVGGPPGIGVTGYYVDQVKRRVPPPKSNRITYTSKRSYDKLSKAEKQKINLPKVHRRGDLRKYERDQKRKSKRNRDIKSRRRR